MMKYPANGTMRKSQGPAPSNQAKDRPKSKTYRESVRPSTGVTSSGKPSPKAGSGSNC